MLVLQTSENMKLKIIFISTFMRIIFSANKSNVNMHLLIRMIIYRYATTKNLLGYAAFYISARELGYSHERVVKAIT